MRRLDLGRTVALAWVVATVGVTVALAPRMGARGWMWLAVNAWLCAFGAGWEIWKKEKRDRVAARRPGGERGQEEGGAATGVVARGPGRGPDPW